MVECRWRVSAYSREVASPSSSLDYRGWPFTWGYHYFAMDSGEAATIPQGLQIHYGWLVADVGIAIGILILVAMTVEFILRRRSNG